MADDKKNIPDAGKVDEHSKPGKVEPVKADPPVQDQSAPAKSEAPVVENASKVVTPPVVEQSAPAGKEVPKDKDAPAPSKEGMPPGKDEKQTTIPGMGDPAPAGKVVDFTAARDGATKGKPAEKAAAQDKDKQADKTKDAAKPRRGRPPKAEKATPDKAKPQPRDKMGLLTKWEFSTAEDGRKARKRRPWRQFKHFIILLRFKATAERRQWSSAASIPRRKMRVKLWPHFCAAKVPSHQICRFFRACRYSSVLCLFGLRWTEGLK